MPPRDTSRRRSRESEPDDLEALTDVVLLASRALVAIAVRSVAAVDPDVTLSQYRVLVALATHGPQNLGGLSQALGIHPSTATRHCDRLVAKRLLERAPATEDRRETVLTLTSVGQRLTDRVTALRRREVARVLDRLPKAERRALVSALRQFADAALEGRQEAAVAESADVVFPRPL